MLYIWHSGIVKFNSMFLYQLIEQVIREYVVNNNYNNDDVNNNNNNVNIKEKENFNNDIM